MCSPLRYSCAQLSQRLLPVRLTQLPWVALFIWCFSAATVRAQSPQPSTAVQRAAAESLFNAALSLLDDNKPNEACPKLAESQRLDPGVGTLLYLADCYRQLGKTASAWATFRDAAYQAKESKDERQAVAVQLADELLPELSYLTIKQAVNEDSVLEVTHNGHLLGNALLGTAVPVDPGNQVLVVRAPERQTFRTAQVIPAGAGRHTIKLPKLAPAARGNSVTPPVGQDSTAHASSNGLAWALVGTGAAALAGGGILAFLARNANQQANGQCRPDAPSLCNDEGVTYGQTASNRATWGAVSAGLGLLALGAGVTLFVLPSADSADSVTMTLQARHQEGATQLQWRARW